VYSLYTFENVNSLQFEVLQCAVVKSQPSVSYYLPHWSSSVLAASHSNTSTVSLCG